MKMKDDFTDYLKAKGLSHSTIETYEAIIVRFREWLQKQNTEPEQVRYADVLVYMKHCQQQGVTQRTIQSYLLGVKNFYEYLIEQQRIKTNPVLNIKVQGIKRKTLYHILEPHELHAIYHSYQTVTLSEKRNKVMLGLLVYQGVKSEDLFRLEVQDIKLREGKVEVHASRKTNARTLQLEPHQVLDIYDYVMQIRPQIIQQSGEKTERLFVGQEGGKHQHRFLQTMMDQLCTQHPKLNVKQIRASVIVKWLRQYNLREVQYLAGHRYISSTEAYQQNEMEGLSEEVNQFHPLG